MPVLPSKTTTPRPNTPAHIQHLCRQSAEARLQANSKDALTLALQAAETLDRLPADKHNPAELVLLRWSVSIEAALVNVENCAEYPDALRFALQALKAADEYAGQTGEQQWRSFVLNVVGDILVRVGQPQEGLQYCLLALPMRIAEGDEMSLCWSLVNTAKVYIALGKYDHALQYTQTAQKYALSEDMHYAATIISTLLAKLYLLRGDYSSEFALALEAIAHAEALVRGAKSFPQLLPETLVCKAAMMRHQEDLNNAVQALDEAEIIAGSGELRAVLVEVYRERARVMSSLHKPKEAENLRERAAALEQRIKGEEIQVSITRILDGTSPLDSHTDLLRRLRTSSAAALGQSKMSSPLPLPPSKFTSRLKTAPILVHEVLTATEWHIANLLADGWTSVEIADALYISKKTAENHHDNIGVKIGSYYAQPRASKRIIIRFLRSFG
jgi:ATP/maltotriose-dependent transcriptional regulator MalT